MKYSMLKEFVFMSNEPIIIFRQIIVIYPPFTVESFAPLCL